ncbi:MAG: branched-chain amino acid ABC transporter permease [Dehalococcoidia bacterium]
MKAGESMQSESNSTQARQSVGAAVAGVRESFSRVTDPLHDWWAGAAWHQRWGVYGAVIIGLILLPLGFGAHGQALLFYPLGAYILLAIGLNVVVGQAGLLDLGYVAFFAIGGYTTAVLGTTFGLSFWQIIPLAVVAATLAGLILGTPTLRLRGDYLAIVTLGFGEIVRVVAENTEFLGAARGMAVIRPPDMFGVSFSVRPLPYYYMLLVLGIFLIIFVRFLERSRVGRAWTAMREDEDAAELMGVPTFRFKILAFIIGAWIGGLAGVVFAVNRAYLLPDNFKFILSATFLVCVMVGGAGNLPGVIVGAFLVAGLPEWARLGDEYRVMIFSGLLVLMMVFRPQGLLPSRQRRAELQEGTGTMGSMGAEVAGPGTSAPDQGEVAR